MSWRFTISARDEDHLSNIVWIAKDYLALNATGPFSVSVSNGKAVIELQEAEDSFLLQLSAWSELLEQSTQDPSELNIIASFNSRHTNKEK